MRQGWRYAISGVILLVILAGLGMTYVSRQVAPAPTIEVVTIMVTATVEPSPTMTKTPIATWTSTVIPTPTQTPMPTVFATATPLPTISTVVSPLTPPPLPAAAFHDGVRWIEVDLSTQTLKAYEGQNMVRVTPVSTGLPKTPTPVGLFRISRKYRYDDMEGVDYYLPNVPYVMYFYQGYALHGTYWHTNFGQPASHGCVNLPTDQAQWLYEWADLKTWVSIHE